MKLLSNSKIQLYVVTDLNCNIETEFFGLLELNLLKLLECLSFFSFMNYEIHNKTLTLAYDDKLISLTLVNCDLSWNNIFIFKNVRESYENF